MKSRGDADGLSPAKNKEANCSSHRQTKTASSRPKSWKTTTTPTIEFCLLINLVVFTQFCYATKESFSSKEIGLGDQDEARSLSKVMRHHYQHQLGRHLKKVIKQKNDTSKSPEMIVEKKPPIHLHELRQVDGEVAQHTRYLRADPGNLNSISIIGQRDNGAATDYGYEQTQGDLLPVGSLVWVPKSRFSSLTTRKYILPDRQLNLEAFMNSYLNENNDSKSSQASRVLATNDHDIDITDGNLNYLPRVARSK